MYITQLLTQKKQNVVREKKWYKGRKKKKRKGKEWGGEEWRAEDGEQMQNKRSRCFIVLCRKFVSLYKSNIAYFRQNSESMLNKP